MKSLKLEKYIPHKEQEEALFQSFVSKELLDDVVELKKKQSLTWKELVEGLFKFYLDQYKS